MIYYQQYYEGGIFMRGRCRLAGGLVVAVILLCFLLFSGGCSAIDRFFPPEDTDSETSPPVDIEMDSGLDPLPEANGETVAVTLYFGDPDGETLKAETRTIPKAEGIARATIGELLKGPVDPELLTVIPEGTELRDINVRSDGTCIVDFSNQLLSSDSSGSGDALLAVYSIVDTLTEFPTIGQVEILIDSQRVETSAGGVDLSYPVTRDDSKIKT
jgi:germination protein M